MRTSEASKVLIDQQTFNNDHMKLQKIANLVYNKTIQHNYITSENKILRVSKTSEVIINKQTFNHGLKNCKKWPGLGLNIFAASQCPEIAGQHWTLSREIPEFHIFFLIKAN